MTHCVDTQHTVQYITFISNSLNILLFILCFIFLCEIYNNDDDDDNDNDDDDDESLVIHEQRRHPFLCFRIRDPEDMVYPDVYLDDRREEIIRSINSSPLLRNRQEGHFRAFIWADSYFIRPDIEPGAATQGGGQPTQSTQPPLDPHEGHRVIRLNTNALRLLPLCGLLNNRNMQEMTRDLGNRFQRSRDVLEQSG